MFLRDFQGVSKSPKNKRNSGTMDESINLLDVAQIHVSFCKSGFVRNELFDLLQQYFIKHMDSASAGVIISYALANSVVIDGLSEKYKENHKVLLENIRNLK